MTQQSAGQGAWASAFPHIGLVSDWFHLLSSPAAQAGLKTTMGRLFLSLTVAHNKESNLNPDHTAAVVLRPETTTLLKSPNRKWERLDNLLMQKIHLSLCS